ncbi:MAG: CYTH domain-containing protein [Clostridia bacterium]|nr:CYTH domain-containing protein [Clostridia bacterium]
MEIERKFLVGEIPSLEGLEFDEITQAYISINPEIRVRKRGNRYYRTEKGEGAMIREENEWEITKEEYLDGVNRSEGRIIEKTRYCIPYKSHIIELDIYKGKHDGLVVCEIEFESEADAISLEIPKWFGKEITHDIEFRNKMLALK